jgi:hypothetical protein
MLRSWKWDASWISEPVSCAGRVDESDQQHSVMMVISAPFFFWGGGGVWSNEGETYRYHDGSEMHRP